MAEREEETGGWVRQSREQNYPRSHCLGGDCNMCSAGEGESGVFEPLDSSKCAQDQQFGTGSSSS